jgi:hypothetical protein
LIPRIKEDLYDFAQIKQYVLLTLKDLKERAELNETTIMPNHEEGTYIPEYMDQTISSPIAFAARGSEPAQGKDSVNGQRLCFVCNSPNHVARNCPQTKVQGFDGSRPYHPNVDKQKPSGRGGLVIPIPKNYSKGEQRYRRYNKPQYSFRQDQLSHRPIRSYYQPQEQLVKNVRDKVRNASAAGIEYDNTHMLEELDNTYRTMRRKLVQNDDETVNSIRSTRSAHEEDVESAYISMISEPEADEDSYDTASSHYDFGHTDPLDELSK